MLQTIYAVGNMFWIYTEQYDLFIQLRFIFKFVLLTLFDKFVLWYVYDLAAVTKSVCL